MFSTFFTKQGVKCNYQPGDVLVDCGSIPTHVFLLLSGYVKASVTTPRGNEHILIFYKPNEIFPARWAFTEIKGNALYTALTNVVVQKVPKSQFRDYLLSNPQESLQAVYYTTMIMDVFVNRVNDMAHLTAYLKLVGTIVSLASRFGKSENDGIIIEIPLTHADLASTMAMTRETVSREIRKLETKNLVNYKKQHLFIPNFQNLMDELNSVE